MPSIIQPKYPHVKVITDLNGPDGNAFSIIGRVQNALKMQGVSSEEQILFFTEATSGDYENLLAVCGRWVTFRAY